MQHAALHVQGQHIVWQQVFIKLKNTSPAAPCQRVAPTKDQMHLTQKSNPWQPGIITAGNYYGFAAAGAGPISVAVLIESSLGQPLSR